MEQVGKTGKHLIHLLISFVWKPLFFVTSLFGFCFLFPGCRTLRFFLYLTFVPSFFFVSLWVRRRDACLIGGGAVYVYVCVGITQWLFFFFGTFCAFLLQLPFFFLLGAVVIFFFVFFHVIYKHAHSEINRFSLFVFLFPLSKRTEKRDSLPKPLREGSGQSFFFFVVFFLNGRVLFLFCFVLFV